MIEEQIILLTEKVDKVCTKVDQMHGAIFGIEGVGGLHRCVKDHDKQLKDLVAVKNKTLGVVVAVSFVASTLGSLLIKMMK